MHGLSVLPAVQLLVLVALMGWMVTGFTRLPGRWLRWKMFCRATFTVITLTGTKDGRSEPVNVYDYLSPGSFILGPQHLQALVAHLVPARYDRLDGHGRVLNADGEHHIEVRDSHVVL